MTEGEIARGLQLLDRRLDELRQVDAGLTITLDMRPDLPLCLVQLCGVEVLVDPTTLIKRVPMPQPDHDTHA